MPHIGDAYREEDGGHRSHLGASMLGQECPRQVWYGFRWATKGAFPGRILRLFNRGHMEEGRIIAQFLSVGFQVFQQDENGNQYRISWAEGHAGGSGDGIGIGFPELPPGTRTLLEFKTHGESSFVALAGTLASWRLYVEGKGEFKGKGVKVAKYEHYVQMQLYMRKMGIAVALYVAVNKNSDDQYMEIITLDTELADQYLARGENLVWAEKAPPKISKSAGFFKCRFCDHRPVCHLAGKPDFNCRTCQFSKPVADGKWVCNKHNVEISKDFQRTGCSDWFQNDEL